LAAHAINPFLEPPPNRPVGDAQAACDIRRRGAMKKAKHKGLAKRLLEGGNGLGHGAVDLGVTNELLRTCDGTNVCHRHSEFATVATV
jgi:hypothetical protein